MVAEACSMMRLRPDYRETVSALDELVRTSEREVQETGRRHPYQWQLDQDYRRRRYYGALLVALVATIAWGIDGGSFARSPEVVWQLAGLLFVSCLVNRWLISRGHQKFRRNLDYWALDEYRRRHRDRPPDPLSWRRRELIRLDARTQEALRRHPSTLVRGLAIRLPKRIRDQVWLHIRSPDWRLGNDWNVLASAVTLHADSPYSHHMPFQ